jgi:hypothetical protein
MEVSDAAYFRPANQKAALSRDIHREIRSTTKTLSTREALRSALRSGDMSASNPIPSTFSEDYWIDAHGPSAAPQAADRGGKWLLFVDRENVDEVWKKISQAVRTGGLGPSAKVSTARANPLSRKPDKHVIYVYTLDAEDENDVHRVRDHLRQLGFQAPIAYKTNKATLEGEYSQRKGRVAKYF